MKKIYIKNLKNFEETKKEWLKDPKVKKDYEDLKPVYEVIDFLIRLRNAKKITQKQLADLIDTQQSSIARFESGKYNPTLAFVKKLTNALGAKIKIEV